MPKQCNVPSADSQKRRVPHQTIINRYLQTSKQVKELEDQVNDILFDCRLRTGCFLHWGPWCLDYVFSLPFGAWTVKKDNEPLHYEGIEDWQVVLAKFYAEEATRLVREREVLLKQLYVLASELYERGERPPYSLTACYYPHLRKPWF